MVNNKYNNIYTYINDLNGIPSALRLHIHLQCVRICVCIDLKY